MAKVDQKELKEATDYALSLVEALRDQAGLAKDSTPNRDLLEVLVEIKSLTVTREFN